MWPFGNYMESSLDAPIKIRSKIMKPVVYAFSVRDKNLVTHTVNIHSNLELTVMSGRLGGGGSNTDFESAFKSLCRLASPEDLLRIRNIGCHELVERAERFREINRRIGD